MGRREEALRATQEAVDLFRALREKEPGAYRIELAAGLSPRGLAETAQSERAYLEVDMPEMIAWKRELIGRTDAGKAALATLVNEMEDRYKRMRAVGARMIIAPPLVITRAQIDEMIELIHRCLDLTLEEVRRNGWAVT
jgi:hypothetical protein